MPTPDRVSAAPAASEGPETDASGLIGRLRDHLNSPDYRGPPLLDALRRPQHDACPADLPLVDQQAYTFLSLCQPPPGKPLRSVRLEDLDVTSAIDFFRNVACAHDEGEDGQLAVDAVVMHNDRPTPRTLADEIRRTSRRGLGGGGARRTR